MASGITHIFLVKNLQNIMPKSKLKTILGAGRDFLQVGAVAPDLPYASLILDNDLFFSNDSELADKFHYVKTNQIPLKAFSEIKKINYQLSSKELRAYFCFFMGYLSHLIADGIVHPFVRDKVGNYKDNQSDHRKLEMQLDVLFCHHLTLNNGFPLEFNETNIHKGLMNITSDHYPEKEKVLGLFDELIKEVYNETHDSNEILGWIKGLYRMFDAAEGIPKIYREIPFIDGFSFSNYEELRSKYDDILTLERKKEGGSNFAKKEKIHFFDDVVPHFYNVFIPIAEKVYNYIYENGPALTENEISGIDLDTGRIIAQNNDLELIPFYWS